MNYKIGDKVNISLTTPLIVTDLDNHLDRIKVSSEDGDIYFWASPKFFTPHTPPSTSPHKSLNIGDLIVTKPTAHSIYADPIGNRIGRIERNSATKDCYVVRWFYDTLTHKNFENCVNVEVVYIDQFSHVYTPYLPSKNRIPLPGDIVITAPGVRSVGGFDISNLMGYVVTGGYKSDVNIEWITPQSIGRSGNLVNVNDIIIIYQPS